MPDYLDHFEIDWSWPKLDDEARAIVRKHEAYAQADPGTLTYDTLSTALVKSSPTDLVRRQK